MVEERVRSRDIPKDQRKTAPAGGSGIVHKEREEVIAGAIKDGSPVIGWPVAYYSTAQKTAGYKAGRVIAAFRDQLTIRLDDGTVVHNIFHSDNPRVLEKPALARNGVWDWAPGFEKEKMKEGAVLMDLLAKVSTLQLKVAQLEMKLATAAGGGGLSESELGRIEALERRLTELSAAPANRAPVEQEKQPAAVPGNRGGGRKPKEATAPAAEEQPAEAETKADEQPAKAE